MAQVPHQNPQVPQDPHQNPQVPGPLQKAYVPHQNPQVPQGSLQNPQVLQGPLQNPHFPHQNPQVRQGPLQNPYVPHQNPQVRQGPLQNPYVPHQNPQVPQGPLQNPHVLHQDPEVPPQDQQIPVPKKNKGRQRVDVSQKMQNEANLHVTFSKRRNGLFKKASELVTLCGVELMMIVFSPTDKPYSYGHPSVDNIIDRFLTGIPAPADPTDNIMAAQRNENSPLLNMQLTQAQAMLEAETHRELELQHDLTVRRTQHRWEAPIEEQSHDELLQLKAALEALQVNLAMETQRRMQQEQHQNPSAFQAGPSGASSSFRAGDNVFPPFPPSPNPFGSGFSQFLDRSSSSGGVGGAGLNHFGGSSSGTALPFSTRPGFSGAGSSSVPPFSQFSTGSSSVGVAGTLPWSVGGSSASGAGALPFSTWSAGSSSTSGGLPPFPTCYSSVPGSSGFSGGLPPFPGEASSSGHGGAVPFPPGRSSFERGNGSGSREGVPMPPIEQSSRVCRRGRGFGRGVHFLGFGRGAHVRGFSRGRGRGCVRGHQRGSGRGS